MGLEKKLTKQGSPLSKNDGANESPMPGTSPLSKLHYEYSINGDPNMLGKPEPSILDLEGITPLSSNRDSNTQPINNSFRNGTYKNSAPPEAAGRI